MDSTSFKKFDEEFVLRKLGDAESIYDYEWRNNSHLFVSTFLFDSKVNIILERDVLNESIKYWKHLNPLLQSKIILKSVDSLSERYFLPIVSQCNDHMSENIILLQINEELVLNESESNTKNYLMQLFERELNIKAKNDDCEYLWRLYIVCLGFKKGCFRYAFILNIHHALTDARNTFSILKQLLEIIECYQSNHELSYSNKEDKKILPSLEQLLFQKDGELSGEINLLDEGSFSNECQIPSSFSSQTSKAQQANEEKLVFESVLNPSKSIYLKDLKFKNNYETKFKCFNLNMLMLNSIINKCKTHNLKLTGFLNIINVYATRKTYLMYSSCSKLSNEIFYHLMVSLRPYLSLACDPMGFYSTVLNVKLKFNDEIDLNDENEFWKLAKLESDLMHHRLDQKEHIVSAKSDTALLNSLTQSFPNGGGVHFALSNLGQMTSKFKSNSSIFEIKEFYYQVSMQSNRWASVIFNGISSLTDESKEQDNSSSGGLFWGITYNSNSIRDEIISFQIENVKYFLSKFTNY